jgi:hypothetical protein
MCLRVGAPVLGIVRLTLGEDAGAAPMSEQDPARRPRSFGGVDVIAQDHLAALGLPPSVSTATHSLTPDVRC